MQKKGTWTFKIAGFFRGDRHPGTLRLTFVVGGTLKSEERCCPISFSHCPLVCRRATSTGLEKTSTRHFVTTSTTRRGGCSPATRWSPTVSVALAHTIIIIIVVMITKGHSWNAYLWQKAIPPHCVHGSRHGKTSSIHGFRAQLGRCNLPVDKNGPKIFFASLEPAPGFPLKILPVPYLGYLTKFACFETTYMSVRIYKGVKISSFQEAVSCTAGVKI